MKEEFKKQIDCLDKGFVRLVDFMGTDDSVVQAARVSYGKGTKKKTEDRGLIRYMMRNKHSSPFEMVCFKFHIKAPIFIFRQWHRHRVASINELSARYSELPEECYVPDFDALREQSTTNKQGRDKLLDDETRQYIKKDMERDQKIAFQSYHVQLDRNLSRELARINLPLSVYSEMYWKMDLRNLFHFLQLRMDEHAQWEIRQYASAIFKIIKPIVPLSCEAFEDYVLNSVTLSAQEMEIIKGLIGECREIQNGQFLELSKRELDEFCKKMGWKMSTI